MNDVPKESLALIKGMQKVCNSNKKQLETNNNFIQLNA